jgi:hypothetical protein
MDNWQKLCEQVIPLIKNNATEDLFHSLFETYLKTIFNWDIGSIRHKMPVPMGRDIKEADIVLVGSNYGIVIEMKNPSVVLGDKEIGQLTSYMRILGYKFGFLIGNEFRVFYDDDTNSGTPIQIASFEFDPNNSDGISLCNILDKSICSNEKLKEYAIMHIKRMETQQKMKQLKTELLNNNGEKIKEIIKNKLMSDGYDENYINDILNNIVISYKPTNNQPQISVSSSGIMNGTGENRTYDDDIQHEIKRIQNRIPKWFNNKDQINSKILYAYIKLLKKNGSVSFEELKNEVNVDTFYTNYTQMKNFGSHNHGKIFEEKDGKIIFWKEVENIIWNYYNNLVK